MARTVVPFGPQHPVLPEPLQLQLVLEDEKVVDAIPTLGYVHRGLEKGAEFNDFNQNVFLVERVCGICSIIHAWTYSSCIEQLLNVEVPPRAQYLRVVFAELSRMHSHLLWLGLYADAFGLESLFMQFWRIRERVLDLEEMGSGNRIILSNCIVGGMRRDIDDDLRKEILKQLEEVRKEYLQVMPAILNDYTVNHRTRGVGVLSKEDAYDQGAVGPVLRASGIASDARLLGYGPYKELGFEPVVEKDGDCYARGVVRAREVLQSMEIIKNALEKMPEGEIAAKVKATAKVDGEAFARQEQPRGEVLYYVRGKNDKILDRIRIRTPTFANIPPLLKMLPGCDLADVPVIVLAIDPCISCTER